jgi:hypothetical protein
MTLLLLFNQAMYTVKASDTEDGKKRLQEYYSSLGRFIDMFAQVETALTFTLWHYAKTPPDIAKIIFSGDRVDNSSQYSAIGITAEPSYITTAIRMEQKRSMTFCTLHGDINLLRRRNHTPQRTLKGNLESAVNNSLASFLHSLRNHNLIVLTVTNDTS